MRYIAPHLHISFHVWLLFILLFWYLRWGGVVVTLGVNGLVDGMFFFPFCGVVNVEIGEKSTISTNRIVLWAITKTIYFNKWLNNDQICLILYFFPFSVVVHVGVGGKNFIFTKNILLWAPIKKMRSLLLKMALQWSDLTFFFILFLFVGWVLWWWVAICLIFTKYI